MSLPAETDEYRAARAKLLEAEIALRDQREEVAALRRALPPVECEDYAFQELVDGELRDVPLSGLFSEPGRPLVLLHFMFGKKQEVPCPMCTMWADGYDGVVPHLGRRVDFAVLVAGDAGAFGEYARTRGWNHVRIVSAAGSTIKRDLGLEEEDGSQWPGVSVFVLEDGKPRHTYTGGAIMAEGEFRGMDLLSPVWHVLDLTPEGRGDWYPSKRYD